MVCPPFRFILPLVALGAWPLAIHAQPAGDDTRPLSAAQVALFMTPQLKNVEHPETLQYHYTQTGKEGFEDTVLEHILAVHPDGTKAINVEYLTGEHHRFYPGLDNFAGNPVLMLFLETDVQTMKQTVGISATYFRDVIREAMVNRAQVRDISYQFDGKPIAAREVSLQPFVGDARLEHLPSVQAKTYRIILSDAVPGGIALLQTSMPADPNSGVVASGDSLVFQGVVQ